MFLNQSLQILYILLVILVVILVLFLFLFPVFRQSLHKRTFKKKYYKVINKLVLDKDYLLINNFIIKNANIHIDHIIFAKKYIYLIKDSYFPGAVEGDIKDNKWIFYPSLKRSISTVENPFIKLHKELENLAYLTGLNPNLFYCINVINDNCLVDIKISKHPTSKITAKAALIPLINEIEASEKVKDINQIELEKAANDIARINERKRRNGR